MRKVAKNSGWREVTRHIYIYIYRAIWAAQQGWKEQEEEGVLVSLGCLPYCWLRARRDRLWGGDTSHDGSFTGLSGTECLTGKTLKALCFAPGCRFAGCRAALQSFDAGISDISLKNMILNDFDVGSRESKQDGIRNGLGQQMPFSGCHHSFCPRSLESFVPKARRSPRPRPGSSALHGERHRVAGPRLRRPAVGANADPGRRRGAGDGEKHSVPWREKE